MSIGKVDFGRLDAESEVNLATYFVDTGVLEKLRTGKKKYVIGRKGSGKTALFRLASKNKLDRDVVNLDFSTGYAWESHKLVKESGLSQESAFVASWRFTFLIAIVRHWTQSPSEGLAKESTELIERIYGKERPSKLEIIFDKFRRIRTLKLPEVTGVGSLGGFELDDKNEGPLLAGSMGQWCRVLFEFASANFSKHPVTIVLDGLDDGWDASADSRLLLVGVLKAARESNLKFSKPTEPPTVLTFLRSDIYDELQFNDKNKIFDEIEFLDWDEARLVEVPSTRIARSLTCSVDEAWARVFSLDEMRQRATIKSYMLKRTMGRPRDMIAFCLKVQEVAAAHRRDLAQTDDVYEAEGLYSRHIYDELDDEMHKQIPEARDYLQTLRDLGRTRFTFVEWVEIARKLDDKITEVEARRRLTVLFEYSVVGVPRRGGAEGGTTFQFNYHDRLLRPNFDKDMIVHLSLKKHLQLVEGRRDVSATEEGG